MIVASAGIAPKIMLLNGAITSQNAPQFVDCRPCWRCLSIDGFVQTFSVDICACCNFSNTMMFNPVRKGGNKDPWVFVLKRVLHKLANLLGCIKILKRVQFAGFYFFHFYYLLSVNNSAEIFDAIQYFSNTLLILFANFSSHFLRGLNIATFASFAAFIAASKQNYHFSIYCHAVNFIAVLFGSIQCFLNTLLIFFANLISFFLRGFYTFKLCFIVAFIAAVQQNYHITVYYHVVNSNTVLLDAIQYLLNTLLIFFANLISHFLRGFYNFVLCFFAAFIAAAKQKNHLIIYYRVVNSRSFPCEKLQFPKIIRQLFSFSEVALGFNPAQALHNFHNGLPVFVLAQPFRKFFGLPYCVHIKINSIKVERVIIVACRLQCVNRSRKINTLKNYLTKKLPPRYDYRPNKQPVADIRTRKTCGFFMPIDFPISFIWRMRSTQRKPCPQVHWPVSESATLNCVASKTKNSGVTHDKLTTRCHRCTQSLFFTFQIIYAWLSRICAPKIHACITMSAAPAAPALTHQRGGTL